MRDAKHVLALGAAAHFAFQLFLADLYFHHERETEGDHGGFLFFHIIIPNTAAAERGPVERDRSQLAAASSIFSPSIPFSL